MEIIIQILMALALAASVAFIAWQKKWLTAGGAIAAVVLGTVVWLCGGWKASIPLLLFFISGSMLSLGAKSKNRFGVGQKDEQPRDFIQVFCNGGVAGTSLLLYAIFRQPAFLFGYWASLSISTADTWSSSIGTRFGGKVVDIKNFRPLTRGLSGGVSWLGTLGAFAGALLIGIPGKLLYNSEFPSTLVVIAGFAGMLLDSVLGSVLQAKYKWANGILSEYIPAGEQGVLITGFKWMTNDVVNLISNLLITLLAIWISKL